jgi:NAD(P)H-hydrate repair Nnr-like enzyme with NAD(P)H-hydrate dehydratase domain
VAAQGAPVRVIGAGDAVLATGGSGDVLSGVIGALLARGLSTFDAATGAAHVHGRAGELLAGRRGEGWTASDVAAAIPEAVGHLAG